MDFNLEYIEKIEESAELLEYRFSKNNIPMWLFVRYKYWRGLLFNRDVYIHKSYENKISFFDKYFRYNPYSLLHKDIMYINYLDFELKSFQNSEFTHFIYKYADLYKSTCVFIPYYSNIVDLKAIGYKKWKIQNNIDDECEKRVRKNKDKSYIDSSVAKQFIKYLIEREDLNITEEFITYAWNTIMYVSDYFETYVDVWMRYLSKRKPKIVILGWAFHVGASVNACISACKRLNIPTAEIQHAAIGRDHPAYYFGESIIKDSNCIKILPDYLLTVGDYWGGKVRIPSQVVNIGTYKEYSSNDVIIDDVLYCVTFADLGIVAEILHVILETIAVENKVYVRTHPEVNPESIINLSKTINDERIIIANKGGIEQYLHKCKYVITEGSTVAFEALSRGCIVYGYADDNNSRLFFEELSDRVVVFNDIKQFGELWQNRKEKKSIVYSDFYDSDYENKYLKFISKFV